jgi:hypothetical protein
MNIFPFFRKHNKMADNRPDMYSINLPFSDNFSNLYNDPRTGNSYLYNAWIHIAVNILIRNIARADFVIKGGLPKELFILNRRKVRHERDMGGGFKHRLENNTRRWSTTPALN